MSTAFKRAHAIPAMIAMLAAQGVSVADISSRGAVTGSGMRGANRSKYEPHQGAKEIAKRAARLNKESNT